MTVLAARPLVAVTEKEWQTQVRDLATALQWKKAYHTFDSRRSASGFPDLVLVRERVLFLELKTEKGRLSAEQAGWLDALLAAGAEAYLVRPRHLEGVGRVLAHRRRPQEGEHEATDVLIADLWGALDATS